MEEITYDPIFAPLTVSDEVPEDISFEYYQNDETKFFKAIMSRQKTWYVCLLLSVGWENLPKWTRLCTACNSTAAKYTRCDRIVVS